MKTLDVGNNVSFAGMDVTSMPLRAEYLDCVTDMGCFGNVIGSDAALREYFRVPKPRGLLYLNDAITEGLEKFPDDVYPPWISQHHQADVKWEEVVNSCGFNILETRTGFRQQPS